MVEQSLQQFSEQLLHVVLVRLVDYPLGKSAECPACDGTNKGLREEEEKRRERGRERSKIEGRGGGEWSERERRWQGEDVGERGKWKGDVG